MLEISPKGTVPVLILNDGTVLEESLDIMRWALQQRDPENWLNPDQGGLSEMETLIHINDHEFKKNLDRYKYPHRYENVDKISQRQEAERFIKNLEERLNKSRFLFGSRRSFADIAIVPFIRQFINTDKTWFETTPYGSVRKWVSGLLMGPDFETLMAKYPVYTPGSDKVQFPTT